MMRRVIAAILILWALGFVWFAGIPPQPAPSSMTDAIVVPTGAGGRIQRGLEMLRDGQAEAMLVTGVDPEVKPAEFAAQFEVPDGLMDCCVVLGFEAVDTRGNASEAAQWAAANDYKSLRLVTTDWHMRRAAYELSSSLPNGVTVIRDAVPSEPSFGGLLLEYHKLLASVAVHLWPG
jgi:uncharacterized SAM-binding protein YcdF (DUF218 family)